MKQWDSLGFMPCQMSFVALLEDLHPLPQSLILSCSTRLEPAYLKRGVDWLARLGLVEVKIGEGHIHETFTGVSTIHSGSNRITGDL